MGLDSWWRKEDETKDGFFRDTELEELSKKSALLYSARSGPKGNRQPSSFDTLQQCTGSAQCAAGYACVGGECRRMGVSAGGGGGSASSAGDCSSGGSGSGDTPCNTGSGDGCQQEPGCDKDGKGPDRKCCGEQCCKQDPVTGKISCFCGKCPEPFFPDPFDPFPPFPPFPDIQWPPPPESGDIPGVADGDEGPPAVDPGGDPTEPDPSGGIGGGGFGPGCSTFCSAYFRANGEAGPGCSTGPDGNSCDSCSYCSTTYGCLPSDPEDAPCWCGDGEQCGEDCQKCVTDPVDERFGECAPADDGSCQECATVQNYRCSCNKTVTATACQSVPYSGPLTVNLAQQKAAAMCATLCKPEEKDPCEPSCIYATFCTDTGSGVAQCPPGLYQTGFLEVGGESCVICQRCTLPDDCGGVDCNCHSDCPDCFLCGSNGECYPNPVCAENP